MEAKRGFFRRKRSKKSAKNPSCDASVESTSSPTREVPAQGIPRYRDPGAVDVDDDEDDLNPDAASEPPTPDARDPPIDTTDALTVTLLREGGTPLGMQVKSHMQQCRDRGGRG